MSNLAKSIDFYEKVLGSVLLSKGRTTAYFQLAGTWVALNEEPDIVRNDIEQSYTHLAFTVEEHAFEDAVAHLRACDVRILPGRQRSEEDALSVYFTDPDGHKFEFHTGSLQQRLTYYRDTKPHVQLTDDGHRLIELQAQSAGMTYG